MRRALALLVATRLLVPGFARGEEAAPFTSSRVCAVEEDPPTKAADLVWKGPTKTTNGVWLTDAQSHAVGERVLKCEGALNQSIDSEARCAVTLARMRGDVKVPRWVFVAVGIAVGVAGGYVANRVR